MKRIKNLTQLGEVVSQQLDIHQEIDGKMNKLDFIRVLQMKLIDLIEMVNNGKLYYSPEY